MTPTTGRLAPAEVESLCEQADGRGQVQNGHHGDGDDDGNDLPGGLSLADCPPVQPAMLDVGERADEIAGQGSFRGRKCLGGGL